MSENDSLIQLRVDEELKREFFELAQRNGESSSNYLRGLMRQAVTKDRAQVADVAHDQTQIREILREMLSLLQRSAFMSSDEQKWQLYKETSLPEYLHELIGDTLYDSGLTGEKYSERFKEEIRQNWFVDTSRFQLPLASYLRRDFMDGIRQELGNRESSQSEDKERGTADH